MRIGIYINQGATTGGGFYEAVNAAKSFNSKKLDVCYFSSNYESINFLKKQNINVKFIPVNNLDRICLFLRRILLIGAANAMPGNIIPVRIVKKFIPKFNRFEKYFKKSNIDLIYFTSPDANCIHIENLNYVITVWDLAHNTIPFFPELRANNCFESREIFYRNVLSKSYAIVVGHFVTKDLLINNYNQCPSKIFNIPFRPSLKLIEFEKKNKKDNFNKLEKIGRLPNKYLFHPGQYAAHKNHRILIESIHFLKNNGKKDFGLVLAGKDSGNLDYLRKLVHFLGLEKEVIFLPFLSDEEIYMIFKNSFALAMPSFIGPANLPPMEAMYIKIPLLIPDFDVNKKFYKNSCIYYENGSAESLAKKIIELDNFQIDRNQITDLATKRYQEIMLNSQSKEFLDYLQRFSNILNSYNDSLLLQDI